jgi:cysteinyl-tRNA synthetase
MTRPIFLTNSKSHQREQFIPLQPGQVKFYSCGPTVYAPIHIGNLRAGLTADLIARFFKYMGYEVTYVRNYTDLDDKIIKRANDESRSCDDVTREYIAYEDRIFKTLHLPRFPKKFDRILGESGWLGFRMGALNVFHSSTF